MYTIIYGTKTFVLDNNVAADLLKEAHRLRTAGDLEAAKERLSLAVKVENGDVSASDALEEVTELPLAA